MSRYRLFWRSFLGLAAAVIGLAASARPALAHDGGPHDGPWWTAWSLEPAVLLLLGGSLLFYLRGRAWMARRAGGAGGPARGRVWAFAMGMAALALALLSPVDAMAGELFWVHMLQHNLLILVAAPLLVLAYPLPPMLLGLPAGARRGLGLAWSRLGVLRGLWKGVSSPPAAWLLHALLLWAWHSPVLYQAALENEALHALEHFSFFGSALLFWWVALHTYGARPAYRGLGVLYVFTTALQSGFLGALLTFSTRLWYPIYLGRSEAWGISALADQQLAGTIMWVPSGLVYLVAALWLLKSWIESIESKESVVLRDGAVRKDGTARNNAVND